MVARVDDRFEQYIALGDAPFDELLQHTAREPAATTASW